MVYTLIIYMKKIIYCCKYRNGIVKGPYMYVPHDVDLFIALHYNSLTIYKYVHLFIY